MDKEVQLPHPSEPLNGVRVSPWPSACALVTANLFPAYGVLALDWPVFQVLALFWMEVAAICVVAALSMLYAPAPGILDWISRLIVLPFFVLGSGILILTYGLFLAVLFKYDAYLRLFHGLLGVSSVAIPAVPPEFSSILMNGFLGGGLLLLQEVGSGWFAFASIGALAAGHLIAFFRHYAGRGEFRNASMLFHSIRPLMWLALLQVVVVAGGAAAMSGDSPVWAPLLLIGAKTAIDLFGHIREWSRLRPPR